MRFDIGKAGIAAIALGTILLSTCVFIFGVVVGWDVGSQSQLSAAQMATAYPLQAQPAQAESPPSAAATSSAGPAMNNTAPRTAPSESVNANPAPAVPVARATSSETASAMESEGDTASGSPPSATAASPAAGAADGNASPPAQTAAVEQPRFPRSHRKPFNIQIEAAMDLSGANQMIKRLQQLGYPSHLVPTTINAQQWYKVEVGPYTTQEEAAAAEAQLRVKYNAAYGGASRPAQPAESDSE